MRRDDLSWPILATPREILLKVAEDADVEVVNLDVIPHDLWPAGGLPALTLVERLSLLLAGFGMTFQTLPSGIAVELIPLPEKPQLEARYQLSTAQQSASEWQAALPGAEITVDKRQIVVRGTWEDHEQISRLLRGDRTTQATRGAGRKGTTTYRITVHLEDKPLLPVLTELAERLGLELKIDHVSLEDAGIALDSKVSCHVENATPSELFEAVLKPLGLRHELKGKSITVLGGM
jgi:hypothetical protein